MIELAIAVTMSQVSIARPSAVTVLIYFYSKLAELLFCEGERFTLFNLF